MSHWSRSKSRGKKRCHTSLKHLNRLSQVIEVIAAPNSKKQHCLSIMDTDTCLVCAEELDDYRLRCVAPCGHDNTCSICFLRIRALNREMSCPTCKRDLEHVIATSTEYGNAKSPKKMTVKVETWNDFEIWGDNCNSNHVLDERSSMFFPKEYIRKTVDKLWAFKCTQKGCGAVKRDIKALKAH